MEFTPEEKAFLKNLLANVTIRPSDKDALVTVTLIQSILGKLG